MGLLSSILLAPFLGPVKATEWTLEKVDRVVKEQLTDDTPVKEEFMALQLALESGEIDDDEYIRREAEIMSRLRAVREWREKLGMASAGGPVRVAREQSADEDE